MIVLGIETSTELVGVCVGGAEGPIAGVWVAGRRRHAETLAPAIAQVLEQSGHHLRDLTAVAVDVGPGLFTGLRVGVATAKGLALGLGIGVVGFGSLTVLARAALDGGFPGTVVPVIDARRGEVFLARYAPEDGPGEPGELVAPRVVVPEEMARLVADAARSGGPVLAVGDGALRYSGLLRPIPGVSVAGPSLSGPPPSTLVSLATSRLRAGGRPEHPDSIVPDYLRGPDARINWRTRGGSERSSSTSVVPGAPDGVSAGGAPSSGRRQQG